MIKRLCAWWFVPPVAIGVLLLVAIGCGGPTPTNAVPAHEVHAVSGRVTVQGRPAEGVRVRFVGTSELPNSGGRVLQADAFTTADGSFQARAYPDRPGLPAGAYAVLLSWPVVPLEDNPADETDRLQGRYSQGKKPAFTVEVKPGTNTLPPFDVK